MKTFDEALAAAPVQKVIELQMISSDIRRGLLEIETQRPDDWKDRLTLILGRVDELTQRLVAL